jgi:hypothetical protein
MPQAQTIVNRFGKVLGWNNVSMNVGGRDIEGMNEISYSDSQELEVIGGAGPMPIGVGAGEYKASAKIKLILEEVLAMQASLPKGTRLAGLAIGDIVVQYNQNDVPVTDIIHNCYLKGNGRTVKRGDKDVWVEFELLTTHITYAA